MVEFARRGGNLTIQLGLLGPLCTGECKWNLVSHNINQVENIGLRQEITGRIWPMRDQGEDLSD